MNKTLSKVVLTIIFSLASLSANAEYTFTALDEYGRSFGFGGGGESNAFSINNSGQIVGTINYSAAVWNDVDADIFWDDWVATDISPQRSFDNTAISINNSGQIAGNLGPYGYSRATIWNNGVATQLTNPQGASESFAYSINNSGNIVGNSYNPTSGRTGATVWNNGVPTQLDSTDSYSVANSINDLGQIVGQVANSYIGTFSIATIWNNGVITELGSLGGDLSNAKSINNLGQIVGYSQNADGINRATIWNNGVATDLNSFLSATDIETGWVLSEANDINDNGWIVGTATFRYSDDINSTTKAFVLTSVAAVPEADTSAMLLIGLGVIGFMVRRRKNTQA